MMERHREVVGLTARVAMIATAVSLWVYIPYRYAVRPPEAGGVLGTAYALLFPLAALLALWALAVAWRPDRLERLAGEAGPNVRDAGTEAVRDPFRWILGGYGGAWLLMGVSCVPGLAELAAASPVEGLFSTLHMTAQHVFLGLVAVTAAWRPEAVRSLLVGTPAVPSGAEATRGDASS